MLEFLYQKKAYRIAESFEELTAKQYIKIIDILTTERERTLQELQVLQVLMGCSLLRFFFIPLDVKQRMLDEIQWVWGEQQTTKNLIPVYKGFYGPADEFNNLTMAEWNSCELYFFDFKENGNIESLNDLVAVLYRKPKPFYNKTIDKDGDVRQAFSPNVSHYHAERKIKYWPDAVKYAVLAWFDTCREQVFSMYEIGQSEGSDNNGPGMFELIRNLSGDRWGSFEKVEQMDVHKVMREIELLNKEAEEYESKLRANG